MAVLGLQEIVPCGWRTKGKKILARIKVKEGGFSADDAVDFGGPRSKTPLVQVKYPEGVDVTSLYGK